jgi:magnesium-transporting ATPase (P-type)
LVSFLQKKITKQKDGTQAARSSDYAIRQFQHVKKLIAVHGRWNYLRNSTIVQYWCYKNTAFIFVLFWFGIDCGWSGQNYYDSWIITLFNVFFTALPPLFFAFAEQDVSPAMAYRFPQLYRECQEGKNFTILSFVLWILEALYVSAICYFFSWAVFTVDVLGTGLALDLSAQGNMVSIFAITIVNLRMMLETRHMTWFIHLSYWISFGLLLLVLGIETLALSFTPTQYGVFEVYMGSGIFWLLYLLVVVTSLLPAIVVKSFISMFWPWDSQICREMEKKLSNKRAVQMTSVASVTRLVPNKVSETSDDPFA